MKENTMSVNLICRDPIKSLLNELLTTRNIHMDETANICLVEEGCTYPEGKLIILFELVNLHVLVELLDKFKRSSEDGNDTIIGKSVNENYEILSFKKICFFEGRGNNTYCITAEGEYRVKDKLYELEQKLPNNRFIRVSKSFIINIENVKQIVPWFGRRLVIKFGPCKKEVEVSKNYTKNFKEFLGM